MSAWLVDTSSFRCALSLVTSPGRFPFVGFWSLRPPLSVSWLSASGCATPAGGCPLGCAGVAGFVDICVMVLRFSGLNHVGSRETVVCKPFPQCSTAIGYY